MRHLETEKAISGHSETLSDTLRHLKNKNQARNQKRKKKNKNPETKFFTTPKENSQQTLQSTSTSYPSIPFQFD